MTERAPLFSQSTPEIDESVDLTFWQSLRVILPTVFFNLAIWIVLGVLVGLYMVRGLGLEIVNGNFTVFGSIALIFGFISLVLFSAKISFSLEVWTTPLSYFDSDPTRTVGDMNKYLSRSMSSIGTITGMLFAVILGAIHWIITLT